MGNQFISSNHPPRMSVSMFKLFFGFESIPGFEDWAFVPKKFPRQRYGIYRLNSSVKNAEFIFEWESITKNNFCVRNSSGNTIFQVVVEKEMNHMEAGEWTMDLKIYSKNVKASATGLNIRKKMKLDERNRAKMQKPYIEGLEITYGDNNWGYIKEDEGCVAYSYFDSEFICSGGLQEDRLPMCGVRLKENLNAAAKVLYLTIIALANPYSNIIAPVSDLSKKIRSNSFPEQGDWGILLPVPEVHSQTPARDLPCQRWSNQPKRTILETLVKNLQLVLCDPQPSTSSLKVSHCGDHVPLTQQRARALSLFSIEEGNEDQDMHSLDLLTS